MSQNSVASLLPYFCSEINKKSTLICGQYSHVLTIHLHNLIEQEGFWNE